MRIRRLLVPTDFSAAANAALEQAHNAVSHRSRFSPLRGTRRLRMPRSSGQRALASGSATRT